ncbi:MAG: hypothetical protein ABFC96_01510 [Thermoguttaceae bacterium]
MSARRRQSFLSRFSVFTLALMAALWLCPQAPAAEGLAKLDTSLKLIPDDAAIYWSMMRNREQYDIIRNSKALAKFSEMPLVQMALGAYNMQLAMPDSPVAKFDAVIHSPEYAKLIDLAIEMASEEIFLYGDKSAVDSVRLFQIVNAARSYSPLAGLAAGEATEEMQRKAVIGALAKNTDLLKTPNLILGFKVKNLELAKEQLTKLETIINLKIQAAGIDEQMRGHFKKTKVGNYEFLVADLNGSMLPWDDAPLDEWKEMESQPGDVQKIVDRVKQMKVVIAIGLRDNYLICSIGPSLERLQKLTEGPRLADRPEFKPLDKFADKRLTTISYVSHAMNQQLNNQRKQLDDLLRVADQLLPASGLKSDQQKRIRTDAKAFTEDMKSLMPQAGAESSVSFLTDRGVEAYGYTWGDHGLIDASKPLSLLQHVGGNPLLGIVARQKPSMENYDMLVKWLKTGYGYFRDFGLPAIKKQDPKEFEKTQKFLTAALPLFERMDKANREMLMPALADGQSALVIDGKLTTKRLVESMQPMEKSMPMVEPAMVLSVANPELLKKGMAEYRSIVNGLIDAVRKIEGTDVPPNLRIPEPQVTKTAVGTIYSFPFPAEWGVDKKIVLNFGLSDKVAVASVSHAHTERLLKQTPLSVGGVLTDTARPLAVAGWLDWAGIVDAATPWIDFAVHQAMVEQGIEDDQRTNWIDQLNTALSVLKVLRNVTTESYLDGDVLVLHTLAEIRDVPK